MQLDFSECIKAAIAEEHSKARAGIRGATAPTLNEAQAASAFSDLWSKLIGLGSQIDWGVVLQQMLPILKQIIAGKSVGDVIAWLMTLFTPAAPAGPSVGGSKKP